METRLIQTFRRLNQDTGGGRQTVGRRRNERPVPFVPVETLRNIAEVCDRHLQAGQEALTEDHIRQEVRRTRIWGVGEARTTCLWHQIAD